MASEEFKEMYRLQIQMWELSVYRRLKALAAEGLQGSMFLVGHRASPGLGAADMFQRQILMLAGSLGNHGPLEPGTEDPCFMGSWVLWKEMSLLHSKLVKALLLNLAFKAPA